MRCVIDVKFRRWLRLTGALGLLFTTYATVQDPGGSTLSRNPAPRPLPSSHLPVCEHPLNPPRILGEITDNVVFMEPKTYKWISAWFILSAPVVIWDAFYCLLRYAYIEPTTVCLSESDVWPLSRPRSMLGGDLHWFWKPYAIYQEIDYVRRFVSDQWMWALTVTHGILWDRCMASRLCKKITDSLAPRVSAYLSWSSCRLTR